MVNLPSTPMSNFVRNIVEGVIQRDYNCTFLMSFLLSATIISRKMQRLTTDFIAVSFFRIIIKYISYKSS